MKKILILALALALSACGALAPVAPTAAPPPTAQVIIQTVLVPVVATQPPTNTPVPPTPTPQVIVVTATAANTAAAPAATASGNATATATLPSDAGGLSKAGAVLFSNLTRSGSYFNFRCPPQDITFGVSTADPSVSEVDIFYRMEDLTIQPPSISAWKNFGKMSGDKSGNYTIDVSTLQLSTDLRDTAKAWFDYEFVGIAKDGNSVGNSGKISQQILYLKDCP
ncbi:MAG TPA: hypothetical protein VLZ89_05080 [Anaerolineales bacterium]|nr:hypothetical protein [Anaerolineales bacterium]